MGGKRASAVVEREQRKSSGNVSANVSTISLLIHKTSVSNGTN
jgi:hypothetical protein